MCVCGGGGGGCKKNMLLRSAPKALETRPTGGLKQVFDERGALISLQVD